MDIDVRPLSAHVGAEITGLDMRKLADAQTTERLRAAFRDHHLLVVRQDDVSDADQQRFARLFGEISIRYMRPNENAETRTQYVSNTRPDGILGDGEIVFHQDHVFYERPLTAIILYALDIPKSGSATKFRNAHTILKELPADLVAQARKIRILHLFNYQGDYTAWQDPDKAPPDSPRAWQPLVWVNPETKKDALWVSPLSTVDFEGISREGGRRLTEELSERAAEIDGKHTYVHNWTPGDLVIWDNRMLHHARLPFDSSEARTLRRSSIL
jgi:alpha-ketoglutarate-dependent taurine dioxygenase